MPLPKREDPLRGSVRTAPEQGAQNTVFGSAIEKAFIAGRLLRYELQRMKLRRFDLAAANLELGKKAYIARVSPSQPDLIARLDALVERETQLRQSRNEPASTFGAKVKALANTTAKASQIAGLKFKRRRLLKQLGKSVRQDGATGSLAEDTQHAAMIENQIGAVETEMKQIAPQTYPWARRPLLLSCLLLLGVVSGAAIVNHRHLPSGIQQNAALSQAAIDRIIAQQPEFSREVRQRQAEAAQREKEATEQRIAAADHQYKAQADSERAEREKRQREEAQERERAATERARLEEKQREEARLTAAAQERQEEVVREERKRKEVQYAKLEQERAEPVAQDTSPQPSSASSPVQSPPSKTASMPEGLEQFEKIPHDPQLLDKLYQNRLQEIGQDKMDLVAVLKGFQDAHFQLKDNSDLKISPEQFRQISRYFSDLQMAVELLISQRAQPNYLKTLATIDQTGGVDGQWAQTTYKNFIRLLLQRASGEMPATPPNEWRLMKRLIVKASDPEVSKSKPPVDGRDQAVVEKQIRELDEKDAQVILADYGDPSDKSTIHQVHLAFWYRDVPILRRDLLAVSRAHPLAELGNIAVTEVPQTLGEAQLKHAEAMAAEKKKVEVTPEIDNPRYLAWKGFSPAASATYAKNSWKQQGNQKQPLGDGSTEIRGLQSIDNTKALVKVGDKVQTIPAKTADTRDPEERKAATSDVIELNGKQFKCSRRIHEWKDWDRDNHDDYLDE